MLVPLLATLVCAGSARIDTRSLVAELGAREELARLAQPDWTLEQAHRVLRWEERDGRREAVLAEAQGPGAFVRLAPAQWQGHLRLYLGEAREPAFEAELAALVGTKTSWPALRTSALDQLRFPLPFSGRARLTLSGSAEPDVLVSWRRYAAGTEVADARAPAAAELAELRRAWEDRPRGPEGQLAFTLSLSEKIPAGEFLAAAPKACAGPRAVSTIVLRVDGPDRELALRSLVLHLAFDGEETVACPLWVLARAGELDPRARGLWTSDVVLRWIMPYQKSFELFVENLGPPSTHVSGSVHTQPWSWDERSLHFGARWIGARGASELALEGQGQLLGIVPASIPARFERSTATLDGAELESCPALALLERAPFAKTLEFRALAPQMPLAQRVALFYLRPGARIRGREAEPADLESLVHDR